MTILEVVIAMVLLAIILAAAFPLVEQMMSRFQMARDHYAAASIGQARVERARQVPYDDLALFAETDVVVDEYGNPSEPAGRFQRTTIVEPDTPTVGLTKMTVRTQICICSRWGWRRHLHPITDGSHACRFTEEQEEMVFLFTAYDE